MTDTIEQRACQLKPAQQSVPLPVISESPSLRYIRIYPKDFPNITACFTSRSG